MYEQKTEAIRNLLRILRFIIPLTKSLKKENAKSNLINYFHNLFARYRPMSNFAERIRWGLVHETIFIQTRIRCETL